MGKAHISTVFFFIVIAACPLMADVTITAVDAGAGTLQINYEITGDSVVRGIALKLSDPDEGSTAAPGDDTLGALAGDLVWASIDYYYSNQSYLTDDLGGDETQLPGVASTALAKADEAGVLEAAASAYAVSVGVLDNSQAQGGLTGSGVLCTIQLAETTVSDGTVTISIAEDALRGGIVGDDLDTVSVQASVDICIGCDIICKGDANEDGKISIADMSAIVAAMVPIYAGTTPPYTVYPPYPSEGGINWENSDVNENGKVSIADLSAIIAFLSPAYKDTTPPYTYIGCIP